MSDPSSGDKRNAEGKLVTYDFTDQMLGVGIDQKKPQELSAYFEEQKLVKLQALVTTENYDGPTFMTKMESIRKQHPDEMDALAKSLQAIVLDPPKVKEKKTFSINTEVNPDSQYFYEERSSRVSLLQKVKTGGLYVVYGPRQSGKTTLLKEMARELQTSHKFVLGIIRVPLVPVVDFFAIVAKELSEDVYSSNEVCQAASRFSSDAKLDFLSYLFRQDYGKGRKLILFWDSFDSAYNSAEVQQLCAGALREVKNARSSLSAYGAVMCFGTYNVTLVNSQNSSPFPPDALFGPTNLDFTLAETRRLFRQYEREYEVTIHEDVVQIIHGITGGHTGLTNACGRVITVYQKENPAVKDFTMEQWPVVLASILRFVKKLPGPAQMISSVFNKDQVHALLLKLMNVEALPLKFDEKAAQELLNLGFAKLEEGDESIVFKNELVKELAIASVREDPIATPQPITTGKGLIDMPILLQAIFRHFSASQIREAHSWCYKSAPSGLHVPHEAHYQGQFLAVAGRLLVHQGWSIRNEANAILNTAMDEDINGKGPETKGKEKEKGKLDFLLQRGNIRVGIEFVASSTEEDVREHASRSYPVAMGLSQYVVVHIYEHQTTGTGITEADGFAEEGKKPSRLPIFQVQHNKDYTQVKMTYRTKVLGFIGQDKTEKIL